MTKAELEAKAKELGLTIRTRFMDDWQENAVIAVCAGGMGYIAGYFKLLSKLFG